MKKTIKRIIPAHILERATNAAGAIGRQWRKKEVSHLPETYLEEKHICNCQIVLNRRRMLQSIGKQNVVAELGVNRGEFSKAILEITEPNKLHLVDIWGSNRYHDDLLKEVCDVFSTEIKSERVQIHRKLSTDASSDFPDNYFDLIYIDTDHSYDTTRDELIAYAPKMKSRGMIAGHDYSMGNWISSYHYGVIEAVHEFCLKFDWELCYLTAEPLESRSFAIRKIQHSSGGND